MIRCSILVAVVLLWVSTACLSFHPSSYRIATIRSRPAAFFGEDRHNVWTLHASDSERKEEDLSSESTKLSLEEKMKAWEATEDEIMASTLGGVVPGRSSDNKNRSDAFDVGLYIAFPLMVLSGLAFAIFPLIMGNLSVDSVGPPPTV